MGDTMFLLDMLSKNDALLKHFLDDKHGLEMLGHTVIIGRDMRNIDPINNEPFFTLTINTLFLKIMKNVNDLKHKYNDHMKLYNDLSIIFCDHKKELGKYFPVEASQTELNSPDKCKSSEPEITKTSFKR